MATTSVCVHPVPSPCPDLGGGRVVRRFLRLAAMLVLLLGLGGVLVNVVLVGRLERIDDAFAGLSDRPLDTAGRTFLMVGTRPGPDGGADVPWLKDEQSVEAMMLIEVAADGLSARVETLPQLSGVTEVATVTGRARPSRPSSRGRAGVSTI